MTQCIKISWSFISCLRLFSPTFEKAPDWPRRWRAGWWGRCGGEGRRGQVLSTASSTRPPPRSSTRTNQYRYKLDQRVDGRGWSLCIKKSINNLLITLRVLARAAWAWSIFVLLNFIHFLFLAYMAKIRWKMIHMIPIIKFAILIYAHCTVKPVNILHYKAYLDWLIKVQICSI